MTAPAQGPEDYPPALYLVAFVAYVVLGLFLKSVVLNWIVGPLFLLIVLYLVPRAAGLVRVRGRR